MKASEWKPREANEGDVASRRLARGSELDRVKRRPARAPVFEAMSPRDARVLADSGGYVVRSYASGAPVMTKGDAREESLAMFVIIRGAAEILKTDVTDTSNETDTSDETDETDETQAPIERREPDETDETDEREPFEPGGCRVRVRGASSRAGDARRSRGSTGDVRFERRLFRRSPRGRLRRPSPGRRVRRIVSPRRRPATGRRSRGTRGRRDARADARRRGAGVRQARPG